MLVLTVYPDEPIHVFDQEGKAIGQVVLTEVRGDKVRLGFKEFDNHTLLRDKVLEEYGPPNERKKDEPARE